MISNLRWLVSNIGYICKLCQDLHCKCFCHQRQICRCCFWWFGTIQIRRLNWWSSLWWPLSKLEKCCQLSQWAYPIHLPEPEKGFRKIKTHQCWQYITLICPRCDICSVYVPVGISNTECINTLWNDSS